MEKELKYTAAGPNTIGMNRCTAEVWYVVDRETGKRVDCFGTKEMAEYAARCYSLEK